MKNINLKHLKDKIVKELENPLEEEFYKLKRYKIESSLAIIYTQKDILDILKTKLRKTDAVYQIDSVYVVFFKYTEIKDSFKALQNLYHSICPYELCKMDSGLISFKEGKDPNNVVFQALKKVQEACDTHENAIEVYDLHEEFILKR